MKDFVSFEYLCTRCVMKVQESINIRFKIWSSSPHFSDNKEHLLLNPVNLTEANVVNLFRGLKINIVEKWIKSSRWSTPCWRGLQRDLIGAHLVGGCVESEARLIVAASNAWGCNLRPDQCHCYDHCYNCRQKPFIIANLVFGRYSNWRNSANALKLGWITFMRKRHINITVCVYVTLF